MKRDSTEITCLYLDGFGPWPDFEHSIKSVRIYTLSIPWTAHQLVDCFTPLGQLILSWHLAVSASFLSFIPSSESLERFQPCFPALNSRLWRHGHGETAIEWPEANPVGCFSWV